MKIKHILFILACLGISSVFSQNIKLELFNNAKTEGWRLFAESDSISKDAPFIFEKGIIKAQGKRKAYMITTNSYSGNYKLTAEYRWVTDSTIARRNNNRNSGIMYNVPVSTPDEFWPKGIQFQIKDKASGDFILLKGVGMLVNDEEIMPGKSVVCKKLLEAEKTVGEWNTVEITIENNIVTQYLNGEMVNEGKKPSETEGRILLMYEGYPIEFRNIYFEQ